MRGTMMKRTIQTNCRSTSLSFQHNVNRFRVNSGIVQSCTFHTNASLFKQHTRSTTQSRQKKSSHKKRSEAVNSEQEEEYDEDFQNYLKEEEAKQKEEEDFHEMVKQMIAKMEDDYVSAQVLEVPPPNKQTHPLFKDRMIAWYRYVIYEIKWRCKDIYYEYTTSLPYPPGYEPPEEKKIGVPLNKWPWVFKQAAITLFQDIKYTVGKGPPPVDLYGEEALKEWEEKQRLKELDNEGFVEVEEEQMVETESGLETKKVKRRERKRTLMQDYTDSQDAAQFARNFMKSRFILIRNCLNQFIVGYNEGMGREIDRAALLRRQKLFDSGAKLDQSVLMDKVGTVAQSLRKFTDEMKEIATVDEKDLKDVNLHDGESDTEQKKESETKPK